MGQLTAPAPLAGAGLSAGAMAAAVAWDPQFTLPARPRLLDHLVVIPLADGLVVEGTGERQVLRGKAATELIPDLLRLLDGTHGIDDLATTLGRPRQHIHAAVALLYACGLLEDAEQAPAWPGGVAPEVAAVLGRHLDTTRVNRSVGAALTRLAAARVVIVAESTAARSLAGSLRRAGVGQLSLAAADTWEPSLAGASEDGIDLVIALAEDSTVSTAFDALDEWCDRARVPWLRSAYTSAGIELGPRFESGHTACYRCFAREWPANLARPSDRHRIAWYGLVADEAIALLSRVGKPTSTNGVTTLDLAGWQDRTVLIPRRPGCPRCCPQPGAYPTRPGAYPDEVPLALRYEQAVAFPPRHLLNPKDHQHHYRPANLALQTGSKRYPGAHHEELPPPERTPVPPSGVSTRSTVTADSPPAGTVDRDTLAGLLLRTGGRRAVPEPGRPGEPRPGGSRPGGSRPGGKVQRWAPTGGNLGSVQLYLLAVNVAGLAPGWYCYESAEHRLAEVRRCADSPSHGYTGVVGAPPPPSRPTAYQLAGTVADEQLPPVPAALLVLTGALGRVATKYYDFACRIVYLDAGVATAQLQAVADAYRLGTRLAHRWDDRLLHEELRLDPATEPVTAVIGLYGRGSDGARV
jgi:hypothetical protein